MAAMAANLRAFGIEVTEHDDGMTIHGGSPLTGARVGSFGDHRIAMACAILGLFAKGETTITETGCIATSYPTFQDDLHNIVTFQETAFPAMLRGRPFTICPNDATRTAVPPEMTQNFSWHDS